MNFPQFNHGTSSNKNKVICDSLIQAHIISVMNPFYKRIRAWFEANSQKNMSLDSLFKIMREVADTEVHVYMNNFEDERKRFFELIFKQLGQVKETKIQPKNMPPHLYEQLIRGTYEFSEGDFLALPKKAWNSSAHVHTHSTRTSKRTGEIINFSEILNPGLMHSGAKAKATEKKAEQNELFPEIAVKNNQLEDDEPLMPLEPVEVQFNPNQMVLFGDTIISTKKKVNQVLKSEKAA